MCQAVPGLGFHEEGSEMKESRGKTVWPVCPSMTVACHQMDRAVGNKRIERGKKTQLVDLCLWMSGRKKSTKHEKK